MYLVTEEETKEKIIDLMFKQVKDNLFDKTIEELEDLCTNSTLFSMKESYNFRLLEDILGEYFEQF